MGKTDVDEDRVREYFLVPAYKLTQFLERESESPSQNLNMHTDTAHDTDAGEKPQGADGGDTTSESRSNESTSDEVSDDVLSSEDNLLLNSQPLKSEPSTSASKSQVSTSKSSTQTTTKSLKRGDESAGGQKSKRKVAGLKERRQKLRKLWIDL